MQSTRDAQRQESQVDVLRLKSRGRNVSSEHNDDDGSVHKERGRGLRSASSSAASTSRADLSRELLHKLRSMTETIKILSAENEALRSSNAMVPAPTSSNSSLASGGTRRWSSLSRPQLESLLSSKEVEIEEMRVSHNLRQQSALKYKALARRLKEERDRFKLSCQQLTQVEVELTTELNEMMGLVSALRADCESLQIKLSNKGSASFALKRVECCSVETQTSFSPKDDSIKRQQQRSTSLQRKKPGLSVVRHQYSPITSPTPSRRHGSYLGSTPSRTHQPRVVNNSRPGSATNAQNNFARIVKPVLPRAVSANHVASTTTSTTPSPTPQPTSLTASSTTTATTTTTSIAHPKAVTIPTSKTNKQVASTKLPCSTSRIPSRTPTPMSKIRSVTNTPLGVQQRRVASEPRSKPSSLVISPTETSFKKSGISRLSPAVKRDRSRTWRQYYQELESRGGQTSEATSSSFEEALTSHQSSMPSNLTRATSGEAFSSGDEDYSNDGNRLDNGLSLELEANEDCSAMSFSSVQPEL